MSALDITAAEAALKTLYPAKKIKFLGYQKNPLLALMPKNEDFTGDGMKVPVQYGGNQGASRNFATAQANKTPGLYASFFVTRVKDYGLSSIGLEAILASESTEGAFLRLAQNEIDNTVRTVTRNLAISMYGNKGGARGQVASISSNTLTLTKASDIVKFEIGQNIVQSTADGTSGSLGSGNSTITAVDRRGGKITLASATGFSANDFLFRAGDFGQSVSGLPAWIPATAPTSGDNFFGLDRSVDTRLYGQYLDASALTIQEALEKADVMVSVEGGQPSHVMLNPLDFGSLRTSLGSQVVYDKVSSPNMATVSFGTIKLMGTQGEVQIVPDRNCPAGSFWMLDMSTWQMASLDGTPKILENLGNKYIWDSSADSIEVRVGFYGNMRCDAPGYNLQGKLY
jgi:hypothetical protein